MKIYKNNLIYNLLLKYVLFGYNFAFSKISIRGTENIPTDGAVIFAPNHTNAFMDAFTVLKVAKSPVVFVARADVFRNPIAAKIFNFFKIMPIMRMRDGRENLKKNDQIMQTAVEVLRHKVPFGIFCEGTHRMKHSILPLVKGIFRIALQADEALKGEMPVYIVPIGIEYGSYTRYRSTISVQVGEAFNVSEFNLQHNDKTQPELMNIMREELSNRISSLYHCIPDTEDYEAILDLCYLYNNAQFTIHNSQSEEAREVAFDYRLFMDKDQKIFNSKSPYETMLKNRQTVSELLQLKATNPTEYQALISKAHQFATLRRKLNISDETLYHRPTTKTLIIRILTLIITLPYFLFSAIIDLPVSLITWLLFHFIIEDGAMKNSLRLAIILLVYPLIFMTLTIFLFITSYSLFSIPYSLFLILLALPANCFVHFYAKQIRLLRSDYKYLKCKELGNEELGIGN